MKKCPTCEKTFNDGMRFCQSDGTPLIEVSEDVQALDPYQTIVSNQSDSEMETKVKDSVESSVADVSPPSPFDNSASTREPEANKLDNSLPSSPDIPKFSEPSLSPPSFGNLSSPSSNSTDLKEDDQGEETLVWDSKTAPDRYSSGFDPKPLPNNPPVQSSAPIPSPFENPPSPTGYEPLPYKEPEPKFGGQQESYNQTPFDQARTPFGSPAESYDASLPQGGWAPVPAPPGSDWQEQEFGGNNSSFQPVQAVKGQDQTLAIVSLVTGILSIVCCGAIAGVPALVTGYIAKNNVDSNPDQYTGRGFAVAGMILGAIGCLFTLLYIVYIVLVGFSSAI